MQRTHRDPRGPSLVDVDLLDRLFAAGYDPVLARAERAGLGALRRELLATLAGHVVELGAGTGANLAHHPPAVTRLTLCEPVPAMLSRLHRTVEAHDGTARDTEVVAAPAEALPLADRSVDAVVSTLVLCTVHDVDRTLAEIARVLRPDGRLALLEHVHGEGTMARVQRGLDPAWQVIARGCHLTRNPRAALDAAGWDVTDIRDERLPMPGPVRPGQFGWAVPPR